MSIRIFCRIIHACPCSNFAQNVIIFNLLVAVIKIRSVVLRSERDTNGTRQKLGWTEDGTDKAKT